MGKLALLLSAGLLLGGPLFAKEENGALAFGAVSESSISAGNLRGSFFLDVGYQLVGPLFYGFEIQGDLRKLDETDVRFTQTDITYFDLGSEYWAFYFDTTHYKATYTLWDMDLSPRAYVSFDWDRKVQLLGFLGMNYNWQSLDYELRNTDENTVVESGSEENSGLWSFVAGFRVSLGFLYLDYTRFLDTSSRMSWDQFNQDRLGAGITLRF